MTFKNPEYPFWGQNIRVNYCGLQGFELRCEDNDLVIDIGSDTMYRVLETDPPRSLITLKYYDDPLGNICASQEVSSRVLNETLYDYGENTEDLNLFYNCDDEIVSPWIDYKHVCPSDNKISVYFFLGNSFDLVQDKPDSCNKTTLLVDKLVFENLKNKSIHPEELFKKSFEVHYNEMNKRACRDCKATDGWCWSGTYITNNTCLYSNGTVLPPYPQPAHTIDRKSQEFETEACHRCGNMTFKNPEYPFWGQNIRVNYCGLQGFELRCEDNDLVIDIGSDTMYRVLETDPPRSLITLKYYDDPLGNICASQEVSSRVLNETLYDYGENTEDLNLFYNCDDEIVSPWIDYKHVCPSDNKISVYFFLGNSFDLVQDKPDSCNKTTLLVDKLVFENLKNKSIHPEELFKKSFEVHYNEMNKRACRDCKATDGWCWSGTYITNNTCLYSNGTVLPPYPQPAHTIDRKSQEFETEACHSNISPVRCGNMTFKNPEYPFWGQNIRVNYCGLQGFELRCEDNDLVIDIGSDTMYREVSSRVLNETLYDYGENTEDLNLFYNCDDEIVSPWIDYKHVCPSDNKISVYFFLGNSFDLVQDKPDSCNKTTLLVDKLVFENLKNKSIHPEELFKKSFEVHYNEMNKRACRDCKATDGWCWSGTYITNNTCLYSNGTVLPPYPQPAHTIDRKSQEFETEACHRCGNMTFKNPEYPFWGQNIRVNYCGLQGFELRCEDNDLVIDIGSDTMYRVLETDPPRSLITLKYYDDPLGNICASQEVSSRVLNETLYDYGENTEDLNLFYNCDDEIVSPWIDYKHVCPSDNKISVYFFLGNSFDLVQDKPDSCNKTTLLVDKLVFENLKNKSIHPEELFKKSFEVHYNEMNKRACRDCKATDGWCWSGTYITNNTCLYSNGTVLPPYPQPAHTIDRKSQEFETEACHRCGNMTFKNPEYPFWGQNIRVNYCGLQGFELRCEDNDLVIDIGSDTMYRVLETDPPRSLITLKYYDDPLGNICASQEVSSRVLNETLYDYGENTEDLNLFYNCDDEIVSPWIDYKHVCPSDNKISVYFFLGNSFDLVQDKPDSCNKTTLLVDKLVFENLKNKSIHPEELFKKSFEVHYNEMNKRACRDCKATDGWCWSGTYITNNTCLYSNGTVLPPYPQPAHTIDRKSQEFETEACHRCGNKTFKNPEYPFWGDTLRFDHCGLEGFELRCKDNDLVIDIGSKDLLLMILFTYRVLETNRGLLKLNYYDDPLGKICASREISSTVLDETLYDYGDNTEDLNLFYNCDNEIVSPWIDYKHVCPSDNKNSVYFFSRNKFNLVEDMPDSCNKTKLVVDKTVFEEFKNNRIQPVELFKKSFEVIYNGMNEKACTDCKRTGGLCWRGTYITNNTCLYSNGTVLPPYPQPVSQNEVKQTGGMWLINSTVWQQSFEDYAAEVSPAVDNASVQLDIRDESSNYIVLKLWLQSHKMK
ncbi:hypothetical protein POM88_003883 [Heracleum sosnowskyi]|uniref:non-specific serine/threonine protein kinase n=1 Tax=Heracleum sosnowskyi TaxID=360622 RepID=A0AAD8JJF7_9APIA|nr:hypothetical protein POM88_003883 [Heracleum sosnowskyi]